MIPHGFVNSLVTYAEAKGQTAMDAIEAEVDSLFAKVNAGKGSQIITGALNGKSFTHQVNMTVEEKFSAYAEALRTLYGERITRTYADFSGLQR